MVLEPLRFFKIGKTESKAKPPEISEINEYESQIFQAIRTEVYDNFCLMKIRFNGFETSCICVINEGLTSIQPLAILVNEAILDHFELLCPKGLKPLIFSQELGVNTPS